MRRFIVGTDWWTDCDDAVAIRVLSYFNRRGISVDGFCVNACMKDSARAFDVFRKDCGLGDCALSLDREATDFGGRPPYQKRLAEIKGDFMSNEDCEEPVRMYRRLLASTEEPYEIVEIGYPQVLAALLKSEGDEYSPLSGTELIRRKVGRLWMMAGKWDENPGRENNFARNTRASAAAEYLCRCFPSEITFLGWETGFDVISGDVAPEGSLLKGVLEDHGSGNGRSSWDPMLMLLACIGDTSKARYAERRGTASVDAATGLNSFLPGEGRHTVVTRTETPAYYSGEINGILTQTYS